MALPAWRIQSCMGCIPLHWGAIIVGFMITFMSLAEMSRTVIQLLNTELSVQQCQLSISNNFSHRIKINDNDSDNHLDDVCPSGQMLFIVRCALIGRIVVLFICFILSILMVHGARQKKPRLMVPWLWCQLARFFISILAFFSVHNSLNMARIFTSLIVDFYFFLIVNSYYLQLMQEGSRLANVTVLAVARPHREMHITIPSPLKDDPPPPYPGLTSVANPAYCLHDMSIPAPPYSECVGAGEMGAVGYGTGVVGAVGMNQIPQTPSPPPPYPGETPQEAVVVPEGGRRESGHSADTQEDSGSEAAPLVNKSSSSQK